MFDELKGLQGLLDTARKQIETEGKAALRKAFGEFFERHPNIEGLFWRQYTPYWNDGDPCVFKVRGWNVKIAGITPVDDPDRNRYRRSEPKDYISEYSLNKTAGLTVNQVAVLTADIKALFAAAGNEPLELVFGDHATVIATPNGFDVEEYEHD